MVTIRLQRVGKRNDPSYRVVLTDTRRGPKSGGFIEILGSYNPKQKGSFRVKEDRVSHWIASGAQASDTVHNLLVSAKVIDKPKRNVVPPAKPKAESEEKEAVKEKEESVEDKPSESKTADEKKDENPPAEQEVSEEK